MPKYEYACKSCGERIEVKQSFTDDALTECPTCGGVLRKVFSSPGIVLKGPGFYRTDHRSPYRPDGTRPAERDKDHEPVSADAKAGSKESSDSKATSDSKGSDPKGSDSKPDSKGGSDSKASADSKGGSESKASESKASESKPSESKQSRESESRSAPSRRTTRDISAPGSGSSKEPAGSGGSSGDTGGSKDTARTA
jgi:putative FmdB family regulatory protein